ncbi:uncharacterized protein [Apostichopus japonicus]|uniref:uncharacterized protein n=1 Tax=Stichopus japonicus TaxID=307972 RepID=UPI003AB4E738
MKLQMLAVLMVLWPSGAYGACYREWLLDPDDELCEIDFSWEDRDECVNCYCTEYGFAKHCCDMSPYPVIEDTDRCELVQEDCEWKIVPKKRKWANRCRREGGMLIG